MCILDSIRRNMHLMQLGSLKNPKIISSFVRNTSFSSGWLHLAVQCFFAVFTVASFILIVMMAIPKYPDIQPIPDRSTRCYSKNTCMVYCSEVPYFGNYEEDIFYAASRLPESCTGFSLALYKPMFVNETFPANWIPRLRLPIIELSIISGNLRHFLPDAFLNQYSATIRVLKLYDLNIGTWKTGSLVGLYSLTQIHISKCTFGHVHSRAFRSVRDTLQFLTINHSGEWSPANFTGTTQLRNIATVDFSHNNFHDVLNRKSFTGIENCKTLYLNSCKISVIQHGTFDHFRNIEMLFLNDNNLITIPTGLFNKILSLTTPKPRISLHDNLWHCSCSNHNINQLVAKDVLDTDPICKTPSKYKGKTFSEFHSHCSHEIESLNTTQTSPTPENQEEMSGIFYVHDGCYNGNHSSPISALRVLSPIYGHQCEMRITVNKAELNQQTTRNHVEQVESNADWLKFSFFFQSDTSTMFQIGAVDTKKYGLIWYQSSCPNEVYCVNVVPSALRIYNINLTTHYILCPLLLRAGTVELDKCIYYNLATMNYIEVHNSILQVLLIISTGGICLVFGALIVYALVRKHPNLLKGSKRILFVKHKTVDALVLPPKVPARNNLVNEVTPELDEKKIFIVPTNFGTGKFKRSKSTRSNKSNAPSYISALQPTEDQLADWRTMNLSTNDMTSEFSTYSWICNADPCIYTDIVDDKTYESLK